MSADQIGRDLAVAPQESPHGGALSREGVWQSCGSPLEAARGADAVLILTEWRQFASLDWPSLAAVMRQPAWLFDARAIADGAAARSSGLQVWTVGEG